MVSPSPSPLPSPSTSLPPSQTREKILIIVFLKAGGYDAIWILLLSPPSSGQAINRVLNLIENYGELSVKVLSRTAWAVGGERAGRQGMVLERLEGVEGLRGVVV